MQNVTNIMSCGKDRIDLFFLRCSALFRVAALLSQPLLDNTLAKQLLSSLSGRPGGNSTYFSENCMGRAKCVVLLSMAVY